MSILKFISCRIIEHQLATNLSFLGLIFRTLSLSLSDFLFLVHLITSIICSFYTLNFSSQLCLRLPFFSLQIQISTTIINWYVVDDVVDDIGCYVLCTFSRSCDQSNSEFRFKPTTVSRTGKLIEQSSWARKKNCRLITLKNDEFSRTIAVFFFRSIVWCAALHWHLLIFNRCWLHHPISLCVCVRHFRWNKSKSIWPIANYRVTWGKESRNTLSIDTRESFSTKIVY